MDKIIEHLQDEVVRKNLTVARKIKDATREFLKRNGFQEYDTPVIVPKPGERYNLTYDVLIDGESASLADSPQLFKLMLVLAGCDKYYQFAHCFRPIEHEDERHNRLCEFIQIDIEMQADTLSVLTKFAEELIVKICKELKLKPKVQYMDGPYCFCTYGKKMKPDLRTNENEISIVIIEHMPLTNGERSNDNKLIPCHHIFALPSCEIKDNIESELVNATTESFDIVINGIEVGGGDLRIMDRDLQEKMMDIFNVDKERYKDYLEMLGKFAKKQSGGFAIGLERLVMALTGANNIRQTVAFPDFYKRNGF